MKKAELICDCQILHKDILDKVKIGMLDDNVLDTLLVFYKAFSDFTRIRIISALSIHEMCVCDICVLLNMTKSAISHQLKYLKGANIIKSRKEGKEVFYSLKDLHIRELFNVGIEHVMEKLV